MLLTQGLIFYWLSWLLWTIITFFHPKTNTRTQIAIVLLCVIFFSNIHLQIMAHSISMSFLMMMVLSGSLLLTLSSLPYKLFISAIIILINITIISVEIWEPIWMIIPRIPLISFASVLCSILFIKKRKDQLITVAYGMCIGEALHSHLILQYYDQKVIGDLLFLDQLMLTISLLYFIHLVQTGLRLLKKRRRKERLTVDKNIKIPS